MVYFHVMLKNKYDISINMDVLLKYPKIGITVGSLLKSVSFFGTGISRMAWTLRGKGWIPCRSTTNANYSTEGCKKTHFDLFS